MSDQDRTLQDRAIGMRTFYKDILLMIPHYEIEETDALSVFAKILIQAAISLGDSKQEILTDMAMLYDIEQMLQGNNKELH
jgi:hypothetical protein